MPRSRYLCLVLALLAPCLPILSQQPATQDPQALALLSRAVSTMGGSVPADSTATGTITTVAGSLTENGTITILTHGTDQTSEQIQTSSGSTVVYSQGRASETKSASLTPLKLELAVTSQCPDFPLPLFLGALSNPDMAYTYIGLENLNGVSVHHIRFSNTFSSTPDLQSLASFSTRDVWIDASSLLPRRLSYTRRAAGGSTPGVSIDVFFSNYTNVGGILYPFSIQKSVNGTPWATITIQNVTFNTGLTNTNFPVQ